MLLEKKFLIFVLLFVVLKNNTSYSQGSGDPGIGLIDFRTRDEFDSSLKRVSASLLHGISSPEASQYSGIGRTTSSLMLGYTTNVSKKFVFDSKFLVTYITGRLADNFNLSDILTSVNWRVYQSRKGRFKIGLTSGLKIPLTQSADRVKAFPLPMLYQTSLGTFDLHTGISVAYRGGEFVLGGQLPLVSFNRNEFLEYEYPLDNYSATYYFKRAADGFSRISWRFKIFKEKIWLMPMAQAFFRIKPDQFLNPFTQEYISYVDRYFDFAVQGNLNTGFKLSDKIFINTLVGVSGNSVRIDGLDRKFQGVFSLSYKL